MVHLTRQFCQFLPASKYQPTIFIRYPLFVIHIDASDEDRTSLRSDTDTKYLAGNTCVILMKFGVINFGLSRPVEEVKWIFPLQGQ